MKRILVVDDEEGIHFLLREELELEGFFVDTALNGEIALRKFKTIIYDLVILDINMPYVGGIEVLRQIKMVMDIKAPVILHSAYPEDKEDFSVGLADAYVNKSANLEELFNSIYKLIGKP
jgi:DNA-binding response OmpR family regulator